MHTRLCVLCDFEPEFVERTVRKGKPELAGRDSLAMEKGITNWVGRRRRWRKRRKKEEEEEEKRRKGKRNGKRWKKRRDVLAGNGVSVEGKAH